MATVFRRSWAGYCGTEPMVFRQSFIKNDITSRTCHGNSARPSTRNCNTGPPMKPARRESGLRWNPIAWYNGHLERNPLRTKLVTSAVVFAVGDIMAQKLSAFDRPLDLRRVVRNMVYGGPILGPLSHIHLNFLEWLVVKKLAVRTALVPVVKMIFHQFVYFSPITIAIYHISMGIMEGLDYDDVIKRLETFYWPSLKACWMTWPFFLVVNFKLVPVRHQLNVMLVACIAWACFMSLIRASDPGPTGHEALQISDTHNRTVAVCSKTSDATNP